MCYGKNVLKNYDWNYNNIIYYNYSVENWFNFWSRLNCVTTIKKRLCDKACLKKKSYIKSNNVYILYFGDKTSDKRVNTHKNVQTNHNESLIKTETTSHIQCRLYLSTKGHNVYTKTYSDKYCLIIVIWGNITH